MSPDYNTLPSLYQQYIAISRYSRYLDKEKRRETWTETVDRYINFWLGRLDKLSKDPDTQVYIKERLAEAREAILKLEVLPSMRALMTAGKALEKHNVAGYNCAFVAVDDYRVFDEILYVLCCGTGVGFSVEQKYINKLPEVPSEFHDTDTTIVVADSKIGWASSLRELISLLYAGKVPKIDVSKVRPSGSRLKTMGGRASGPGPLVDLFDFVINIFKKSEGRKLTDIECHDIITKIGEIVVCGGVRRSAELSLSDLTSASMRHAKSGNWYETHPYRSLANNSAAYYSKPSVDVFMEEWIALYRSKSGERGIFNLEAVRKTAPERRDSSKLTGVNPCGEVAMRSCQFCNLSALIVKPHDSEESLIRKAKIASFLGTLQSTLTDFKYLRKIWKDNCEDERLLGVSPGGTMSNHITCVQGDGIEKLLEKLTQSVISENIYISNMIGINPSTATTCQKPEGNSSQLCNSSSGGHPWWSPYYLRTVRINKTDPLYRFMSDHGVYVEDDIMKPSTTAVFYFPIKAPDGVVFRKDITAIEHLELWLTYKKHFTEHNPSVTIYVKEHEWLDVGAWVYNHFDEVCGLSFFPWSDHIYKQAPYQEITEEEYNKWMERMPKSIDWTKLSEYETEDMTTGAREYACTGGQCEI